MRTELDRRYRGKLVPVDARRTQPLGRTPQAFLKTLEEPPAATVIMLICRGPARCRPRFCRGVRSSASAARRRRRCGAGRAPWRARSLAEVKAQGVAGALPPPRSPGAREGGGAGGRLLALLPRPRCSPGAARRLRSLMDGDHATELAREAGGAGRSIRSWRRSSFAAGADRSCCNVAPRRHPPKSC